VSDAWHFFWRFLDASWSGDRAEVGRVLCDAAGCPRYPSGRGRIRGVLEFAAGILCVAVTALSAEGQPIASEREHLTRATSDFDRGSSVAIWPLRSSNRGSLLLEEQGPSRLPPVVTSERSSVRGSALELVQHDEDETIRRYKRGFFQRLKFAGAWLPQNEDQGLGATDLETSVTVAIPMGSFQNLLLVTPSFEVAQLDAYSGLDVPDRLFDAGVDFMWRQQFNDRWGSMLAVTPGYSSDFVSSEDAFRIRGRAFATWKASPQTLTLLFGAVYLDRDDLPVLPGAGLIWTPTPDWRLELLFPRPKFARRISFVPRDHEHWLYARGELGGRTWAVERSNGSSDQLTLRDYRIVFGWESVREGGGTRFFEVGAAFDRQLEYELQPTTLPFDRAVFLRCGISF
jgi:hypothetical protein